MADCEDEDCGEESSRRVRCFHCGLLVCGWCWHHVHGCEPGHKKAECSDYRRYLQYGREWIRRLRARLTTTEAYAVLRRSLEIAPCSVCEKRLYDFPISDLGSPKTKSTCGTCGLSYSTRYNDSRKNDVAASLEPVDLLPQPHRGDFGSANSSSA
jgi:hypothetical protein